MTTQLELSIERPHRWELIEDHSYLEKRMCAVCGLTDMRVREPKYGQRTHHCDNWCVTTPCIEPVPDEVPYEALVQELKLHSIRYRVMCVGVPGAWQVGFSVGDGNRVYPYRGKPFRKLEHGFAELLRWIRARQYVPELYSDITYADSLHRHHTCACCDDD